MVLTACLVLQTGGLHRSAGEHGVLQGGNEGEQASAGGWRRGEAGGQSTRGWRRKICNKVTVEREGLRNFWKLSPRAWACSNLSWSTRGVFCAWTWYITITFNIRVFIFTKIFVYWSELTNILFSWSSRRLLRRLLLTTCPVSSQALSDHLIFVTHGEPQNDACN